MLAGLSGSTEATLNRLLHVAEKMKTSVVTKAELAAMAVATCALLTKSRTSTAGLP